MNKLCLIVMRKFEAKIHNNQVYDFFKKIEHGRGCDKESVWFTERVSKRDGKMVGRSQISKDLQYDGILCFTR